MVRGHRSGARLLVMRKTRSQRPVIRLRNETSTRRRAGHLPRGWLPAPHLCQQRGRPRVPDGRGRKYHRGLPPTPDGAGLRNVARKLGPQYHKTPSREPTSTSRPWPVAVTPSERRGGPTGDRDARSASQSRTDQRRPLRQYVSGKHPDPARTRTHRLTGRVEEGDLVVFLWVGAGNGAMNGYAAVAL